MSGVVGLFRSRVWPSGFALALIAASAAGCSSETSRFNENPYASNGAPRQPETTGSIRPAPVSRVETSQLPPPPSTSRPTSVAAVPASGSVGGGRGMASYSPSGPAPATYTQASYSPPPPPPATHAPVAAYNPPPTQEITGSVPPRKPASGNWSWDGGTAVTVAQGETVEVIAHRYGVPASAIMQANNIGPGGTIQPGQRLVIPRYSASSAPATSAPPSHVASLPPKPAVRPLPVAGGGMSANAAPGTGVHVVAPGETLSKISRLYGKSIGDIARANNFPPHQKLNIGDRLVIPGVRTSAAKPKTVPAVAQAKPKSAAPQQQAATATTGDSTQSASVVTPEAEQPVPVGSVKAANAAPSFRWPVKGRVIAGFGPKTNGQQNDGINVAVPENTPVKAAEDGVVAYAGNELKGYGNLVLIRHSNGYVTAYAHAKELKVKRGDAIKRGQVIATSGQTGNVDAPQLHFEIRKGPAPQDPMPMLSGG